MIAAAPSRRGVLVTVGLLGWILAAANGCDASFRFDDHDAAVPADGAAVVAATAWMGSEGCSANCALSCPGPRTCVGTCVGVCTATCPPGSSCALTATDRTTITCESSRCNIDLRHHGVVRCQGTTSCDVVCGDECAMECGPAAHCGLRCAGDATSRAVTGTAACPRT